MFEVGDEVVCLRCSTNTSFPKENKICKITDRRIDTHSIQIDRLPYFFDARDFVTLLDYRKNKILKIKERICLQSVTK